MKNIFDRSVVNELTARINRLTPTTAPQWGKMTVDQMLAHCNVSYEMVYDNTIRRPGVIKRMLLNAFVKRAVVGPKPYPRNSPTAPQFKIVEARDFEVERRRLLEYLQRVQAEGSQKFEGRPSPSFGPLTAFEWNVLFYKHLDHHLTQFGV
jgi:hypothetical protein